MNVKMFEMITTMYAVRICICTKKCETETGCLILPFNMAELDSGTM